MKKMEDKDKLLTKITFRLHEQERLNYNKLCESLNVKPCVKIRELIQEWVVAWKDRLTNDG